MNDSSRLAVVRHGDCILVMTGAITSIRKTGDACPGIAQDLSNPALKLANRRGSQDGDGSGL